MGRVCTVVDWFTCLLAPNTNTPIPSFSATKKANAASPIKVEVLNVNYGTSSEDEYLPLDYYVQDSFEIHTIFTNTVYVVSDVLA